MCRHDVLTSKHSTKLLFISHHKLYQQGKFHYLTSYDVVQHPDCKFMILKHVPLLESLHSAERSMIDYMRIQQEYKIVNKK